MVTISVAPQQMDTMGRVKGSVLVASLFLAGVGACRGTITEATEDDGSLPGDTPRSAACEGVSIDSLVPVARLERLTREQIFNSLGAIFSGVKLDTAVPDDERSEATGWFHATGEAALSDVHVKVFQQLAQEVVDKAGPAALLAGCDVGARGEDGCAEHVVDVLGRRLLRRTLSTAEKQEYLDGLYRPYKAGGFQDAIKTLVKGLVQSPYFLYRIEVGDAQRETAGGIRPLTDFELASRLAFFLWSAGPDDELLDAAAAGSLRGNLAAQARRMLADPRAKASIESFYDQLLHLDHLDLPKDPMRFPMWTPALRDALRSSLHAYVSEVVWSGGGTVSTVLDGRFGYVDATIAQVYGLPAPGGAAMARIDLGNVERPGVLGHPAFLAAHASSMESSVTKRGLVVRRELLCQPIPAPNADFVAEAVADRLADLRCASCHKLMDPIGFGLQHYDAIGRYRDQLDGRPVQASGYLADLKNVTPEFSGPVDLVSRISNHDEYKTCMARQWFRFASGRMESEGQECLVAQLRGALDAAGGSVKDMMLALVALEPFGLVRLGGTCQ